MTIEVRGSGIMNKTIIGAIFTLCGTILFSAILITGAILSVDSSFFWFEIFRPGEWGLAFLFYFAIALFLFGVICLFWKHIEQALKMEF